MGLHKVIGLRFRLLGGLFFAILAIALRHPVGAQDYLVEDFNSSDGGFTVSNSSTPDNPWAYDGAGGTWKTNGSDTGPSASFLTSPAIAVTRTGRVTLVLTHRYSFEYDGTTRWDGG
jgi:hypothetical protein